MRLLQHRRNGRPACTEGQRILGPGHARRVLHESRDQRRHHGCPDQLLHAGGSDLQPRRRRHGGQRLHGRPARRLQRHRCNEPSHSRCPRALRDRSSKRCCDRRSPGHRGSQPLLDQRPGSSCHHGGARARHVEQRTELDRRPHVQPAQGHQRPAEPLRGRRPHRQLPEPGRHNPHRIGLLRPQRDLHAARNRSCHHGGPRRAEPVTVPERGRRAGPDCHRAGALLEPDGSLQLRGRRIGELRNQQLRHLGDFLRPRLLRQLWPGRFENHHRPAGLLHPNRDGPGDRQRPDRHRPVGLLRPGPDAGLRGQRTAGLPIPARSWTPSSRPPSRSTGPAGAPRPRSTMPSPARASKPSRTRTYATS